MQVSEKEYLDLKFKTVDDKLKEIIRHQRETNGSVKKNTAYRLKATGFLIALSVFWTILTFIVPVVVEAVFNK